MIDQLEASLAFHQQALSLRQERQKVLASNIANADTPGYKARDMDFSQALEAATKGANQPGLALARTSSHHLRYQAALTILNSRIQGLKQAMQPEQ